MLDPSESSNVAKATSDPGPLPPGDALRWYIAKWERSSGKSTVPFSDVLRPLLSPSARLHAKQAATRSLAPLMKKRALACLGADRPLWLHLGCGWNHLDGWVNVDLVGSKPDIAWDIRSPLPFPHASASAVFLEHVLEHLSYGEAIGVLGNAHAVLRNGGVLRVGVPDAGMYAREYVSDPAGLRDLRWGRPTAMTALREVFQEHGHVTAWDGETLLLVLSEAGFADGIVTPAGVSRLLESAPDLEERWHETVYAEAIRRD